MNVDRNRYFMFGIVLFLLGLQFRMIDTFVLNESSTKALHRFAQNSKIANNSPLANGYVEMASPKKSFKPPNWLGFVFLTVGGVMSLHALALPKRQ